jgi:hypothetical protein
MTQRDRQDYPDYRSYQNSVQESVTFLILSLNASINRGLTCRQNPIGGRDPRRVIRSIRLD